MNTTVWAVIQQRLNSVPIITDFQQSSFNYQLSDFFSHNGVDYRQLCLFLPYLY